MDIRLAALKNWVSATLGVTEYDVRPASEDASFRRYFRITTGAGDSYIAMDAPPDKENMGPYIRVAERLRGLGLNVPEIYARDLRQGFLLLTDLGDRLYLRQLNEDTVERLYGDALGALITLQAGSYSEGSPQDDGSGERFLPDYDATLLRREMRLFRDWYLGEHCGIALTTRQEGVLKEMFDFLVGSALEQPRVWVHRDYHSRNLLVTDRNNPGIVDFQDAVYGPVTYDLVSLLRDCYIAWPRERVEDWVKGYHSLCRQSGIQVCEDEVRFIRWFDRMGVQRHLKATGIFARLNHRDGKPGYLQDIPRTLGYVLEVCARDPELQPLERLLRDLQVDRLIGHGGAA